LIALLCLKPAQWAEAARYPFRITLWPLLLAIVLAAALVGTGVAWRVMPIAHSFAAGYDAKFAPMLLANGKLTSKDTHGKPFPRLTIDGWPVVVDLTGKTAIETLGVDRAVLIDATQISVRGDSAVKRMPLAPVWELQVDSAGLTSFLDHYGPLVALTIGSAIAGASILRNVLWAATMILLLAPLVSLGAAQRLRIPRQVAYRIAAAVLVPLVLLDGLLELLDRTPTQLVGQEWALLIWTLGAAALAVWAGALAGMIFRKPASAARS